METLKSTVDVLKLLDKSNCKKCEEPTCLAFAAKVFKGQKALEECPKLGKDIIEAFGSNDINKVHPEDVRDDALDMLRKEIRHVDLEASAMKLGGVFQRGWLSIKVLGKDVRVDQEGNISTDIHVNPWIMVPFLNYVIKGSATGVSGKWVPFRELKGGKSWGRFFNHKCEKQLKKIADTYTDLFKDMLEIFNGRQVENHYSSDISLVLLPFPKVPMLISYWKPDDGLESDLNLFFDDTVEEHIDIEAIYTLGVGLVTMFEKISLRHGI